MTSIRYIVYKLFAQSATSEKMKGWYELYLNQASIMSHKYGPTRNFPNTASNKCCQNLKSSLGDQTCKQMDMTSPLHVHSMQTLHTDVCHIFPRLVYVLTNFQSDSCMNTIPKLWKKNGPCSIFIVWEKHAQHIKVSQNQNPKIQFNTQFHINTILVSYGLLYTLSFSDHLSRAQSPRPEIPEKYHNTGQTTIWGSVTVHHPDATSFYNQQQKHLFACIWTYSAFTTLFLTFIFQPRDSLCFSACRTFNSCLKLMHDFYTSFIPFLFFVQMSWALF
jgi:hypothetical protein